MPDVYSPEVRSRVMRSITKKNTAPEISVRRLLHRLGYRFRLHQKKLPGCPDIVLAKHKIAIFVHGCFWHQHSCKLGRLPKSNLSYWLTKLERNRHRDAQNIRQLRRQGWHTMVVWECETHNSVKLERILRDRLYKITASIEK